MVYSNCWKCGAVENAWGNGCWCDNKYKPQYSKTIGYNNNNDDTDCNPITCFLFMIIFFIQTIIVIIATIIPLVYSLIYSLIQMIIIGIKKIVQYLFT